MQDLGLGHHVGVQHQNELAGRLEEGVVEISRLGVPRLSCPLLTSGDVADTEPCGGFAELVPVAVVEDPRLVRIADQGCGFGCRADQIDRLVIRGDEDVHREVGRRDRRFATLS